MAAAGVLSGGSVAAGAAGASGVVVATEEGVAGVGEKLVAAVVAEATEVRDDAESESSDLPGVDMAVAGLIIVL